MSERHDEQFLNALIEAFVSLFVILLVKGEWFDRSEHDENCYRLVLREQSVVTVMSKG